MRIVTLLATLVTKSHDRFSKVQLKVSIPRPPGGSRKAGLGFRD